MRRFLKGACELVGVRTITDARNVLRERPFPLVITDFLFPEGDAIEFITEIRSTRSPTELPVLVVSCAMDRVLEGRVLKAGANEALAKPVDPDELRALVERLLSDPFVREQSHGVVGACCFQWQRGAEFYQYCPELNLTVSGSSRDDAMQQMYDALAAAVAEGRDIGSTRHESLANHVIPF
jgi:DNA-binding response OmpR family regulator